MSLERLGEGAGLSDAARRNIPAPELVFPGRDDVRSGVEMVLSGGVEGVGNVDGNAEARDFTPEVLSMPGRMALQLKLEKQQGINADMRRKADQALAVIAGWNLPRILPDELGDLVNSINDFLEGVLKREDGVYATEVPKGLDMEALGIKPVVFSSGLKEDFADAEKIYRFVFGSLSEAAGKLKAVYEQENALRRGAREFAGISRELPPAEVEVLNKAKHCLTQAKFFIG